MTASLKPRYQQTGAYLLEALIGILIFALGVLGIVGLQAAALRTTTDSSLRAEAVFAASQLVGQMWADKYICVVGGAGPPPCTPQYTSATLGPAYVSWATDLRAAQGGAWFQDPIVDFTNTIGNCNAPPDLFSATAYIQIFWQSPDGQNNAACGTVKCHWYATCAVIGQNINN